MKRATQVERVEALREEMRKAGVQGYLIPGTDPHQSEYPATHFHGRQWISGFHGSAGTVVITMEHAGLWTDSRYFLEAEKALEGTPFTLFKMETPGVPAYPDWIASTLERGDTLACDARLVSVATVAAIEEPLERRGIHFAPGEDLLARIWEERPPLPTTPVYLHDERYAGEGAGSKIARLVERLRGLRAQTLLVTALDEIAWLLNIRGSDVLYSPVTVSYLLLDNGTLTLFIESSKLSPEVTSHLQALAVRIEPYEAVTDALSALPQERIVLVDEGKLNSLLFRALPEGVEVVHGSSPITEMKAIKNEIQKAGIRAAMRRDGAALATFFVELQEALSRGERPRERELQERLRERRAEQELFVAEAFGTIAGYAGNGAIVHYAPGENDSAEVSDDAILLLDSGGQYLDGTTDITRTTHFGKPTEAQRRDYTLVLKGHLALGMTPFPKGTTGHQLDTLARQFLWQEMENYGHGTGHGVGHFLNVHEGPQRISQKALGVALEPGMLISNEPGVYRTGAWGIRIENLVLVEETPATGTEEFYRLETVTLFPYERKLIDTERLTPAEREWVDAYHRRVRRELSPLVSQKVAEWLEEQCAPL
ncbi:MAG: aminopeptidase P family protein [Alkalispirochaetaceae bacterium]